MELKESTTIDLEGLWNQAVESYLASTGRGSEDKTILKNIQNVDDLEAQLESDHRKFRDWRKKNSKIFSTLSKAARPLVLISNLAQSATSATPFAPVSAVLGAIAFLVKAADGVSEAYCWIEDLFEKLSGFTQRLEGYLDGELNVYLQSNLIAILSCLLGILGECEKVLKDGRFRKYTAILFLGKDERVKGSFDKLNKLLDDEQRLVLAISYANTQRIDRRTAEVDRTTAQTLQISETVDRKMDEMSLSLQATIAERSLMEQKALLEKCLDTPARLKNLALYTEYTEDMLQSSGEWLLTEQRFKDWLERKSPILWVAGGPGTGKSYLSAAMISKLRQNYFQNNASVGFFYIKEDDQDLQDLSNILKSIAYQIASVDSLFQAHVLKAVSRPEAIVSPRKIWGNLFLDFYLHTEDNSTPAVVVIDGLDEAPAKMIKQLFRLLGDLADPPQKRPVLLCAVFGRPDLGEYIEPVFETSLSIIEIGAKNEHDIGLFIKKHLPEIQVVRQTLRLRTRMAATKLAREIRNSIMAKADGMFFKVKLIMDQIHNKERASSVFEAIENAPPQLEGMIRRLFDRLAVKEDVDNDVLNEILLWVALTKRPLTVAELYAILQTQTGHSYDALEDRLRGRFASIFKLTTLYKLEGGSRHFKADEKDDNEGALFEVDLFSDETDSGLEVFGRDSAKALSEWDINDELHGSSLNEESIGRFRSIDVRFSHASIRDFLVKERNLDATCAGVQERSIFAVNRRTADIHLASKCIQRILQDDPSETGCDIASYAATYFMDHLLSIDVTNVGIEDKQLIIRLLCQLFFEPSGLKNLVINTYRQSNRTLHTLFENPAFSSKIRREWLGHATPDHYSTVEYKWISEATRSRAALFRPLACEASRMWLTKSGNDDLAYSYGQLQSYQVWIVHCYLHMDLSDNQEVKYLEIGGLTAGWPPSFELEKLTCLAEFSNIAVTSHWHTCFAWILINARLYGHALGHFNQAIEMDSTSWKALHGKSTCLQHLNRYEEAVETLSGALEHAPPSQKLAVSDIQTDLTKLLLARMDFTTAFERTKKIYHANPMNPQAIGGHIRALYALHYYDGIVQVVEELRKAEVNPKDWTDVSFVSLRDVHFEIGCALRAKNKVDLVKHWVHACSCIEDSRMDFSHRPWLAAWIAEFMYSFWDDLDESMRMFEYIVSHKFKSSLGPELAWAYSYPYSSAWKHLCQIYFQKAVFCHNAGKDTDKWIHKLESYALADRQDQVDQPVYRMNEASHLLGLFLRCYKGTNDTSWKPCFRESVLEAIRLVNSADHLNYSKGYARLANILLAAGSRSRAVESLAVMMKPWEVVSNPKLLDALNTANFKVSYECDGPCQTQFHCYKDPPFKELYFCEDCIDTCFCEDCYLIVKRGELPYRKCRSDHSLVRVFPILEEARDVAGEFVEGSGIEVCKDWLDALRKDWE